MKLKKLWIFIAIAAVIALLYTVFIQHDKIEYSRSQIIALTDTVTLYKTKQGKNGAIKTVYIGTRPAMLEAVKRSNPTVYATIKNVKNIQSYTELKTVTRIDTVVKVDTVYINHGIRHTESSVTNPYYTADVSLVNDSLKLGLTVKNDFDIVTRYQSNGFLKPKTLVVDVVNKNPYTVNSGLTSFQIQPKKRTGIKISIGLGVAVGAYLLLR